MSHSLASSLCRLAAVIGLAASLATPCAFAQDSEVIGESFAPVHHLGDNESSMEQIMARLQRAEAALSALQAQQLQPPMAPGDYDAAYNSAETLIADALKPDDKKEEKKKDDKPKEKKWYDKLGIRGYAQVRINEVTHEE